MNSRYPCDVAIRMLHRLSEFLQKRLQNKPEYYHSKLIQAMKSNVSRYNLVSNWHQASKLLISIGFGFIWKIKNYPSNTLLKLFYQHLLNENKYKFVKSMNEIVDNIKHIFNAQHLKFINKQICEYIKNNAAKQEQSGISQCNMIVWFNLFACACTDEQELFIAKGRELLNENVKFNIPEFNELLKLTNLDRKLLTLNKIDISRPIPMESILFKSIFNVYTINSKIDQAYDNFIIAMDGLSSLEDIRENIYYYNEYIYQLLGDKKSLWFKLFYYLLKRCGIEPHPGEQQVNISLNASQTEIWKYMNKIFIPQIKFFRSDLEAHELYDFMMNYPCVIYEDMKLEIFNNDFLLGQKRFLEIYGLLLSYKCKNWKENLRKCIKIWIHCHGLSYCIEIMKIGNLPFDSLTEYFINEDDNKDNDVDVGKLSDKLTIIGTKDIPMMVSLI